MHYSKVLCCLRELMLLFNKDPSNVSKVTKALIIVQINGVLLTFIFSLLEKKISRLPQKYKAAHQFLTLIKNNISWAAYYNDFWRIMWHWRLNVMILKNQLCRHRNKLYCKINRNRFIFNYLIFQNITILLYLWLHKCNISKPMMTSFDLANI